MNIRVQMPSGVSSVSVGGHEREVPEDGVVELDNPEHVAPLVRHGGVELAEDGTPGRTSMLVGTSSLPALVEVVPGTEPVPLGTVVAEAHARTGVSVDEWNNLPGRVRDILINLHLSHRRGEIGDVAGERAENELRGGTEPEPGDKPNFEGMTKAQLNQWLADNGGEEASGNHAAHVAAAETRWAALHAEPDQD
jgi:hypothetical protein